MNYVDKVSVGLKTHAKNKALCKVIEHISTLALNDELIAKTIEKENKSFNEMWAYIISEARKSAQNSAACLTEDEVFGLALHYFDEDDIKVNSKSKAKVTTSVKGMKVVKENKSNILDGQESLF